MDKHTGVKFAYFWKNIVFLEDFRLVASMTRSNSLNLPADKTDSDCSGVMRSGLINRAVRC